MIRLIKIMVVVLLSLWAASSPFHAHAFKMDIAPGDYSALWKSFAEKDFSSIPAMTYPYERCFRDASRRHGVPLTLLLAVARGESDFNPKARSSKSCYGIMQIQWPRTARHLGITRRGDLLEPCRNINAGAGYLREMMDRYGGDIHLALAAYNYGPGRIRQDMRASAIPKGANWYSGYIYHHLRHVLTHSAPSLKPAPTGPRPKYKPSNKLSIILFHAPHRAMGFIAYFNRKAPELRMDWFRTSLGESYVVLLFNDDKDKMRSIRRMKELGYSVDPERGF